MVASRPQWLIVKAPSDPNCIDDVKDVLDPLNLHTVCEEALCPNIGECWSNRSVTFMILGDICTRNCPFCAVNKGKPLPPDEFEPKKLAKAAEELRLKHIVVTSVDRDDLVDKGASQFASCITEIRRRSPSTSIEVLVPDFMGAPRAIDTVMEAGPDILNHNLETIRRLHPKIKPKSDYYTSLHLLKRAKELNPKCFTKSGIMVGLGETFDEAVQLMRDLRSVDCDVMTVGQYLKPENIRSYMTIREYIKPEVFKKYEEVGRQLGFLYISAGPFIRSSYNATELYGEIKAMRSNESINMRLHGS